MTWFPGHTTQTSVSIGSPDPWSTLCMPELQRGLPRMVGTWREADAPSCDIWCMPPHGGPSVPPPAASKEASPPALLSRPATSASSECRRWHPRSGERVPQQDVSSTGRYFTGVGGSGAKLSQPCHTCPGRANAVWAG